jgi:hypothetical protein
MSEDLKESIRKRVDELSKELQEQIAVKEACQKKIRETDVRASQIMGAIHELQAIINPKD